MTTVLQFGYFSSICSSLLGSLAKGEIPQVITLEEGPPLVTLWTMFDHFWPQFWSIWAPCGSHLSPFCNRCATVTEPALSTVSSCLSIATLILGETVFPLLFSCHGSIRRIDEPSLWRIISDTLSVFWPNGSNPVSKILAMARLMCSNY